MKNEVNGLPMVAFVPDIELDTAVQEQRLGLGQAAARESDVLTQVFGAGDQPRS